MSRHHHGRYYHIHRRRRHFHHHGPRPRLTSITIAVDGVWVREQQHRAGNFFSLLWYFLVNQGKDTLMLNVTVGHSAALSIVYLDQNGNPMLTTPTPDPATPPATNPTWTDAPSAAGVDTLTSNADGTATLAALAPGSDNVSVTVTVGGVAFSASLAVAVAAPPQVLTSIAINSVVS